MLCYDQRDFLRAAEGFHQLSEKLIKMNDGIRNLKTESESESENISKCQELVAVAYNMYGIVLQASAKLIGAEDNYALSAEKFQTALEIAISMYLTERSSIAFTHSFESKNTAQLKKFILESLIKALQNCTDVIKKETFSKNSKISIIISNIGFLLNQWDAHDEALTFHKTAFDLLPRTASIINGYAYGLGIKAIKDNSMSSQEKEVEYERANFYFDLALYYSPKSMVIIGNKAQLFLERAEEAKRGHNIELAKELYSEVNNLIKSHVDKSRQENRSIARLCIVHAIACSNLAVDDEKDSLKAEAEKSMKKARLGCYDEPEDSLIKAYFDSTKSKNHPYGAPMQDKNRTMRKWDPEFDNVYDDLKRKLEQGSK